MALKVPYDNDPRPLKPANKNLAEVRESEGPSPTQDGPHRGTAEAVDDMGYLDTSGEMWAYLGHFRKEKFLEEGHNTVLPMGEEAVARAREALAGGGTGGLMGAGGGPAAVAEKERMGGTMTAAPRRAFDAKRRLEEFAPKLSTPLRPGSALSTPMPPPPGRPFNPQRKGPGAPGRSQGGRVRGARPVAGRGY